MASVECLVNGSRYAASGSGTRSMSDSWISWNPRIEEPSNPYPSSNPASDSSAMGMEKCCISPGRSQNRRSTISAPASLARERTSFGVVTAPSPFRLVDGPRVGANRLDEAADRGLEEWVPNDQGNADDEQPGGEGSQEPTLRGSQPPPYPVDPLVDGRLQLMTPPPDVSHGWKHRSHRREHYRRPGRRNLRADICRDRRAVRGRRPDSPRRGPFRSDSRARGRAWSAAAERGRPPCASRRRSRIPRPLGAGRDG